MGTGRTTLDVLREILDGQDLPIVYDFDCGHTHPMYTLPLGGELLIDFEAEQITVTRCSR